MNQSELFNIFGDFRIAEWESKNIVRCDLSKWRKALSHIVYGWNSVSAFAHHYHNFISNEDQEWFGFRCHKLMVEPFQEAFDLICQRGLSFYIITFDGCLNKRLMKGTKNTWSWHSWGIAIDLDAYRNQFLTAEGDMHPNIIASFEDAGFEWGGNWKRPDPMHFQPSAELLKKIREEK